MFGFGSKDTATPDAIDLLKADHRKVDELFEQFEAEEGGAGKIRVATRICRELAVHARVEEELLYPRAIGVFDAKDQDLVWEATVEHGTLAGLIDALGGTAADDDAFEAHVKVLKEYVKHHVKEEENEMFPKLRASGLDLAALGAEILERKEELMASFDLPPPGRARGGERSGARA
jgi:hemerythrin superfamily protein